MCVICLFTIQSLYCILMWLLSQQIILFNQMYFYELNSQNQGDFCLHLVKGFSQEDRC